MRVDYINPFVESAFSVIREVLNCDVKRGSIYLKNNTQSIMGVAAIVGLAGAVEGRILIDMDKDTALKVVSSMNFEEITELDDLSKSTLSELANMVTGHAVTRLHELGFRFDLTPPAVIMGDNLKIHDVGVEALVVPMITTFGKIEINVAIKERR
ncbi:chemotaxis protein CheX [Entomospira nematocerorum]|uniref:Chemotaxis protein CheX n=2 Tax=Entomospira TaxID=2834378 RepID=A0A968KV49_9SPIO|nr:MULTISPECIES: chemotaxis protein CheX [Entomospira]NIZ40627.1 chemotaxis protein CheX [Entomospira entomophilus]NIZ46878.1 chemotaxis protein CheX [Entomospira nematocera]WDI33323.1 chemotaxis protein CheX [Entomospira nematocera]WDI34842.1 chemotaxis protein CheX [Entomospira entomophilus]